MTYPLSSEVTAGQPTAAAHYNNLRMDALLLGNSPADAASLGSLLAQYETRLNLVYLATNRVRVEASPNVPVGLVISGVPVVATANVDLPTGAAPSGAASDYYVFAVASAGSTSFTLAINSSSTEWTGARRIGRFYWNGSSIVRDSIRTEYADYLRTLIKYATAAVCQGRLTLTSATPVMTGTHTSGTLYFTPYLGNTVSLYAYSYGWVLYPLNEVNVSLSETAANTNYDVFLYYTGTNLALELTAWSNDTTRVTNIVLQDGAYVKQGEANKLYVGTIRTTSAGTCVFNSKEKYVWNMYNRCWTYGDTGTGASHSYNSTTLRAYNADNTLRVSFVQGLVEDSFFIGGSFGSGTADNVVQVAIDSTSSSNGGDLLWYARYTYTSRLAASAGRISTIGYHYLQLCEATYASTTLADARFTVMMNM